jgi:flagellar protein FliJ
MKKFEFSLQKVLGFKEQEYRLLEQELMILLGAKKQNEEILQEYEDNLRDEYEKSRQRKKITSQEKQQLENYFNKIKADIYGQKLVIVDLERKIKAKQDQIVEKQKEIKVLDKLKEKQFEEYLYEFNLEERKFMDEVASRSKR